MATTEFIFNNKVHIVTKLSLFKVNYRWESRMSFEITKKRKNVKAEKFVNKIKYIYSSIKKIIGENKKIYK